jgi:hypothetical protein
VGASVDARGRKVRRAGAVDEVSYIVPAKVCHDPSIWLADHTGSGDVLLSVVHR